MKLEIPILVQPCPEKDGGTVYLARPLFFQEPMKEHKSLERAVSKLADALHDYLAKLGRQGSHGLLAAYTFAPDVRLECPELRLELRGLTFHSLWPIVLLNGLDRRLAVSPSLPDLWFEIGREETVEERATAVFTRYLRDLESDLDEDAFRVRLQCLVVKKRPQISVVELDVPTRQRLPEAQDEFMLFFGGPEQMYGTEELRRVGRCQDRLYPDQLLRAPGREPAVRELARLLGDTWEGVEASPTSSTGPPGRLEIAPTTDKRPVMVVGPAKVGKTAVIHEFVYHRVARRTKTYAAKNNVWLLSPQRLISGMSFVGQWENRLLAILQEARKQDHVLYFDDFLGMYLAGKCCSSDLSAAEVLKPYVERREVRLLVEMTPGQLQVFRERDRGFADLFHLVQIDEPDETETMRMLIGQRRRLEDRHRVAFDLDVLPTVVELARRYQPEAAFPGKAAWWLEQLARKYAPPADERYRGRGVVARQQALEEFHAKSGLQVAFLDAYVKLQRDDVAADLAERIIGQQAAIAAMADVVSVAKAGLNDPHKPLATLLFLGPTGVGKTESAKALAAYLFGEGSAGLDSSGASGSQFLRFDMNEFLSPLSAARLVGTFDQPEGLLTSAVRRQPFCVLLFDEIEKAHPDVFDLMLQILGEARLTDALGRTVDFSNAVIILTSNLGTREAGRDAGFVPAEAAGDAPYLKAVQEFFRPEFFNRLDRIVQFTRLSREELRQIAWRIVADLVAREGLSRRKCAIDLHEAALDWVVERGHDRVLGARAMRRAVEREIVTPLAAQLAAVSPDTPSVLEVARGGEGVRVRVHALQEAVPRGDPQREKWLTSPGLLVEHAQTTLDRMARQCEAWRPAMELATGKITAEQQWYLGVAEYIKDTRRQAAALAERLRGPQRVPSLVALPAKGATRSMAKLRRAFRHCEGVLREIAAAQDISDYLRELAAEVAAQTRRDTPEAEAAALLDRLCALQNLLPAENGWLRQRVVVLVRSLERLSEARVHTADYLQQAFDFTVGQDFAERSGRADWCFGLEPARFHGLDRLEYIVRTHFGSLNPPVEPWPVWWERFADEASRAAFAVRYHLEMLVFEGHRAEMWLRQEEGTHLYASDDGRLDPIQVVVLPLAADEGPWEAVEACLRQHEQRLAASSGEKEAGQEDPLRWRPVIKIGTPGLLLDLRSWLAIENGPAERHLPVAGTRLPREFEE